MKSAILIFSLIFLATANPQAGRIKYVKKNLTSRGFSQKEISGILSSPRLKLYPPSPKPKKSRNDSIDWNKLAKNIMSKKSVAQGKQFIGAHRKVLRQAEKKFGVSKEAITAVLRIETDFGKFLGSYAVANLFYNQLMSAKDWQKPADNFVDLFVYCRGLRATGSYCLSLKGSYAGAFGICQFLPSSAVKYGTDGSGDKKVNLFDVNDAIMSAANFLKQNGWAKNPAKALGVYYGNGSNYPQLVLAYAAALKFDSERKNKKR